MRLVVVSHTPHVLVDSAHLGWAATVRELDAIASVVDELVHIAPVHQGPVDPSMQAYRSANIRVVGIPAAGGSGPRGKLSILAAIPRWHSVLSREIRDADAVHVRAPANVAAIALGMLAMRRGPEHRWYKYAGAWTDAGIPVTFALQRWWLRRLPQFHRGVVTVSEAGPGDGEHVLTVLNPAYDQSTLDRAQTHVGPRATTRLLFVGRLDDSKGVLTAVEVAKRLRLPIDIVGDGPRRAELEADGWAEVHGWLDETSLSDYYARAAALILPTLSEGFPKVAAEAMAHGVVPVVTDVGAVAAVFRRVGAGVVVDASSADSFTDAVGALLDNLQDEATAAAAAASAFTYERYVEAITPLLRRTPHG